MVERLEDSSERTPAELRNYFISVSNAIMDHDLRISLAVSKIGLRVNSPGSNKIDLVVRQLLFFEGSQIFLGLTQTPMILLLFIRSLDSQALASGEGNELPVEVDFGLQCFPLGWALQDLLGLLGLLWFAAQSEFDFGLGRQFFCVLTDVIFLLLTAFSESVFLVGEEPVSGGGVFFPAATPVV